MAASREEIQRIFRLWLDLSEDQEILYLLELVERALHQRGYRIRIEIEPPARPPR